MYKIILYLFVLVHFACESDSNEGPFVIFPSVDSNSSVNNNPNVPLTYLALGDSYTIGESVEEEDRWPNQLVEQLKRKKYLLEPPKIIARTGWTTRQLDNAISSENSNETYGLVTLLIGVNNQFQGRSLEEFREEFSELLSKAIVFAKNKPENVIVVSIPDWGVSQYGANLDRSKISSEIDAFNKVKKEETYKRNSRFVDITSISRLALNNNNYIASDGLHFSGEMYLKWVNEIIRKAFDSE